MTELPLLVARDADFCLGSWKNVGIACWHLNTTMASVRLLKENIARLGQSHAGGTGLVTVVEEGAALPSAEVRSALAAALAGASHTLRASAVVHEGTGFAAAAIRGVVAGIALLGRPGFPHKVFGTVDGATMWLVPLLPADGGRPGASELSRAVAELRKTWQAV